MSSSEALYSIESKTLAFEATEVVRKAILSGHFLPGERLIESDLAKELSVSRSTLREAFRHLADEGLIVIRPRKGAHVVNLREEDIREIYEMRFALETLATRKLCQRITKKQENLMRDLIESMRDADNEEEHVVLHDLDMQFHEAICRFSGNTRLWHAWSKIDGPLRHYFFFVALGQELEPYEFAKRHEVILDAIIAGDAELAHSLMEDHLYNALSRIGGDNHSLGKLIGASI